ncbi:MAG TPA: hypothetical protein VMJ33_06560 [Gallionella sp.]|nr:hypothetical protein [Gallionella sp.]
MSIAINVITTANHTRHFTQQDGDRINEILKSLANSGKLFSSRVLIFGSATETEIFSPSSITRIEIVTKQDLTEFLPKQPAIGKMTITSLSADAMDKTRQSHIDDNNVSGRIDFFFEGGDTLPTWIEGIRPSDSTERMMNLTRLFEQPVLLYKLPQGGIGLMNPGVMTRAVIKSGALSLPSGAWRVEPV